MLFVVLLGCEEIVNVKGLDILYLDTLGNEMARENPHASPRNFLMVYLATHKHILKWHFMKKKSCNTKNCLAHIFGHQTYVPNSCEALANMAYSPRLSVYV